MNEDPTKKLSDGESFESRVLSGLAAIQVGQVDIRNEQVEIRREQATMRAELAEVRAELAEMKKAIAALDSRLGSVEERLTSLEEKVDARLRETRPIWESALDNIKSLDLKFDELLSELFEIKADSKRHERLILQLEKLR